MIIIIIIIIIIIRNGIISQIYELLFALRKYKYSWPHLAF